METLSKLTNKRAELDKICSLDTCTVSNAIERLSVRLRNEGFVAGGLRCRFPNLTPMVGYAVTGSIRTSSPPMSGRCYYDRMDFWTYVANMPEPRVLVLQDVDDTPGFGAFVGEIHATICMALNCVGHVTNGAARDLPALEAMGFHLFSGSVSLSHAYAHLTEFGEPVELGGLKICPGELLHGDRHGVLKVPIELVPEILDEAERIRMEERELIEFCRSPQFSLDGLTERLQEVPKDRL